MKYLRISLARRTASRFLLTKRRRKMLERTDVTSFERRIRECVSIFSRAVAPFPLNLRIVLFTGEWISRGME